MTMPMRRAVLLSALAVAACAENQPTPAGEAPGMPPGTPPPGGMPRIPVPPGVPAPPGGTAVPEPPASCTTSDPFPSPIRRLTRAEYNNTVRDLLGDTTAPADRFPADELAGGFGNNAAVLTVSPLLAERYMAAAETLAATAVKDLARLVPCDPAKGEDACARTFVETFGRRAYRRPLSADEVGRLLKVHAAGRAGATFARGVELTLQAILQSPAFLYRIETGVPPKPGEKLVRVTQHELASRLSYLLWATTPDEKLLAAADAGQLGTAADVARTARAMLADPRARRAVTDFYRQWLGAGRLDVVTKDAAVYPDWNEELRAAMRAELPAFVEHVLWSGDGKLSSLLTAPLSVVTAPVAKVYGVTAVAGKPVMLDPGQRAGLLTQPGLLAAHALPDQSSPIHRGKFVREQVLCQEMPEAPPELMVAAPEVDPRRPTRERFAQHTSVAACASCHQLMDPIGFGFEHFDGIGRYRATDGGRAVDANGHLAATADIDGPFRGAPELARKLAGSTQVVSCVTTQWYRYAFGRLETAADACALRKLRDAFTAAGHDLRELLVALVQTDPFLHRAPAEVTP